MNINKPDQGILKGMGRLEMQRYQNRKYFPKIRNIHQFQYTHNHPNSYASTFQKFFSMPKSTIRTEKVQSNANYSSIQLAHDQNKYYDSLSRSDYKQFHNAVPPKAIIPKEQGIVLGEDSKKAQQHFKTTNMQRFGATNLRDRGGVTFKNRASERFNPITGQKKQFGFGFEDFQMGRRNTLKANNCTTIPQKNQRIDIITGRKLTYN